MVELEKTLECLVSIRNKNGMSLIDFCIQDRFLVASIFCKDQETHKYTMEIRSRREKKREIVIRDIRVRRGSDTNSDYYILEAKLKHKEIDDT